MGALRFSDAGCEPCGSNPAKAIHDVWHNRRRFLEESDEVSRHMAPGFRSYNLGAGISCTVET